MRFNFFITWMMKKKYIWNGIGVSSSHVTFGDCKQWENKIQFADSIEIKQPVNVAVAVQWRDQKHTQPFRITTLWHRTWYPYCIDCLWYGRGSTRPHFTLHFAVRFHFTLLRCCCCCCFMICFGIYSGNRWMNSVCDDHSSTSQSHHHRTYWKWKKRKPRTKCSQLSKSIHTLPVIYF